ncbi:MAG: hypothetical protein V3R86_00295 [Candidatus Hydrothermarchaeaceae archaeon]
MELVFNRIFSRAAVFIPKDGYLVSLYNLLSSFGIIIFNLSSIFLLLVLFLIIDSKLQRPNRTNIALSSLLLFLIILSIAFIFIPPTAGLSLIYNLASLASILLITTQLYASSGKKIEKLTIITLSVFYLCSYYYRLSHISYQLLGITSAPTLSVETFNFGEFLVLPLSVLIFATYSGVLNGRDLNWKMAILPTIFAAIFVASNLMNSEMTAIFSIWSLGFTLFLPYPLYAIAIWLFSFTLIKLISQGQSRGYGLAFIFIAGYAFWLSYHNLLLLLGLLLLSEKSSA